MSHTVDKCETEACEECCLCEESENGICNDCGAEVDWIKRHYGHED